MLVLIVGAIVLLALVVLPQLWVRGVLAKHSAPHPSLPGTGGEFARHLLNGMKLRNVKVEETKLGDHYDPAAKAVRLTADHFNGKSLTAMVVAAHEVGHAMQDATGYRGLKTRSQLAKLVQVVQVAGGGIFLASTILGLVLRHPIVPLIGFAAAIMMNLSVVAMHIFTLPVEFDASFKRAMPVLREGRYLEGADLRAAQHILSAAAYTYVAAALISLINVARWIRR